MIGGTVSEPGTNPFGESFPGVTGTTGLIGSNVEVPQGFFSNTLGPGKGDLLSPEVLNALNQANINEPGGFSTAGMSLSDLAEAWGVGLDSAAALAEAGFADFGGGGFGGGGDAQEGGTGPSPGDLGEGPGEGGGGGGGGPPGAGDDDDSDGDGDF